jgi:hypothetical protein
MKKNSIRVALLAAVSLLAAPIPLCAQEQVSEPIKWKAPKKKKEKFKGQVLEFNKWFIKVRSQENRYEVRTFNYSLQVREKMRKVLDQGGYQFGDKVTIEHEPGSDVALRIKGKPSKPR